MYFDYIKEREGLDFIIKDYGFCSYSIKDQECFLMDVYIKPEFRKTHKGSTLLNELCSIARDSKCTYLTARNYPKSFGSSESLLAALKYGFKVITTNNEFILIAKEL